MKTNNIAQNKAVGAFIAGLRNFNKLRRIGNPDGTVKVIVLYRRNIIRTVTFLADGSECKYAQRVAAGTVGQ